MRGENVMRRNEIKMLKVMQSPKAEEKVFHVR